MPSPCPFPLPHIHPWLSSDAFVPAGGRPNTINGDNWKEFLDAKGVPSSPLIVEGANIFTTTEAREHLFKQGVTIVKDSSANKCGVITSSCEVAASMLLSKEEFMDIKTELVEGIVSHSVLCIIYLLSSFKCHMLCANFKA